MTLSVAGSTNLIICECFIENIIEFIQEPSIIFDLKLEKAYYNNLFSDFIEIKKQPLSASEVFNLWKPSSDLVQKLHGPSQLNIEFREIKNGREFSGTSRIMGVKDKQEQDKNFRYIIQSFGGKFEVQSISESDNLTQHFNTLDILPSMAWVCDPDYQVLHVNKFWIEFTGLDLGMAVGDGWVKLIHPEDYQNCKTCVDKLISTKEPVNIEVRMLRKDGQYRWCIGVNYPIVNDQGANLGFIGYMIDVEDHKQLRQDLQDRNLRYEQLFNGIKDALFLSKVYEDIETGPSLELIEINKAACIRLEYEQEELLGKTPLTFNQQVEHKKLQNNIREIINKGSLQFETTHTTKTGRNIPVEINSQLVQLNGENYILSAVRDITDRKEAEVRLKSLNKRLDTIINISPSGIIMMSPNGVVEHCNPAALEILGISKEQGKKLLPYQLFLDKMIVQEGKIKFIERGVSSVIKGTYHRSEGVNFLEIYVTPLRDKDEQMGTLLTIRDVTHTILHQKELEKVREENLNNHRIASLSALTVGIAHEINQPLNVIRLKADNILYLYKHGKEIPKDKFINTLESISSQTSRINDIISHMRSLISSNINGEIKRSDLNEIIREAVLNASYQYLDLSVDLSVDLTKDLPEIYLIKSGFKEAIYNILANAYEAHSIVSKKSKKILVKSYYKESQIIIEIVDNAIGLNHCVLDKIFEPFNSQKEGKGMGLGLFIAEAIVKASNGKISASNNQMGGATFKIEFPLVKVCSR